MKNILLIVLVSLSCITLAQSNSDVAKRIDSLLLSRYNKGLFNGSLLIQKEGEVIYKRSLGWANIEKRDTLKLNYPMRIASITKTYTAVCILQLVDKGLINLHEDIHTYIPEIEKTGITIHHLLSHSSGISYINGGNHFRKMKKYQRERGGNRWVNEDVLSYFKEFKPKQRAIPGEEHSYSNISFTILGSLIERLSGKKYSEYLSENIFKPCNMNNSFLYLPNDTNDNPEKVLSYRLKKGKFKYIPVYYKYKKNGDLKYSDDFYGDKYICSTVEDMNHFNTALLNGKLISNELLEKMKTPVLLNNGKPSHDLYGYGLSQIEFNDSMYYDHGGYIAAFEAINMFSDSGLQIVLLMNIETGEYFELYYALMSILQNKGELKMYGPNSTVMTKNKEKFQPIFEKTHKINYKLLYE